MLQISSKEVYVSLDFLFVVFDKGIINYWIFIGLMKVHLTCLYLCTDLTLAGGKGLYLQKKKNNNNM